MKLQQMLRQIVWFLVAIATGFILHNLVLSPISTARSASAIVSSYFNGPDTENWTIYRGSFNNPGAGGAGGGSGNGYLEASFPNDSQTGYYVAPVQYHGDWRNYSALSLQIQISGGSHYTSGYDMYGDIFISNGRQTAQFLLNKRPNSTWETFVIPLTSSTGWTLAGGATSLEDVLSNVTDFQIRAEYGVGRDNSGLDSVELLVSS